MVAEKSSFMSASVCTNMAQVNDYVVKIQTVFIVVVVLYMYTNPHAIQLFFFSAG
jgi:hypothetical protein